VCVILTLIITKKGAGCMVKKIVFFAGYYWRIKSRLCGSSRRRRNKGKYNLSYPCVIIEPSNPNQLLMESSQGCYCSATFLTVNPAAYPALRKLTALNATTQTNKFRSNPPLFTRRRKENNSTPMKC